MMSIAELAISLDFGSLSMPPAPQQVETLRTAILKGYAELQDEGSSLKFEQRESPGDSKDAGLVVLGLVVLLGASWWQPERTAKFLEMIAREYKKATGQNSVRISVDGSKKVIDVKAEDVHAAGKLIDLATEVSATLSMQLPDRRTAAITMAPRDE